MLARILLLSVSRRVRWGSPDEKSDPVPDILRGCGCRVRFVARSGDEDPFSGEERGGAEGGCGRREAERTGGGAGRDASGAGSDWCGGEP